MQIKVRVTPRSSRNLLRLEDDDTLRAWVTASPTDGQANAAVCELVAEKLGIAKSRVEIIRGLVARDKVLRVEGFELEDVKALLGES